MHPKLLLLAVVLGIGGSGAGTPPVLDPGGVGPQAALRWRSEAAACVIEPVAPAAGGHDPALHPAAGSPETAHGAPPSGTGHLAHAAGSAPGDGDAALRQDAAHLPGSHGAGEVEHHAAGETGCRPSADERARADALVAATRKALTTRFASPQQAIIAGYEPVNDALATRVHYLSRDAVRDPRVLDPDQPEGMIYERGPQGIAVIGAWYIMPKVTDAGPQIGGCLTVWHRHTSKEGKASPEMIHVWIVDAAGGPFAHSPDPPA